MTKRIDCDRVPKAELRKCGCEFCTTQLAEYKAVELNPREIREKLKTLRLYENEGLTPDKIKELKERDAPMEPEIIRRNSAVGCLIGTCPRCGGMLRSYMKFCDECGQRLWWEEK